MTVRQRAAAMAQLSLPVTNLIHAFHQLGRQVDGVLRAQLGDAARLNQQKEICGQFLQDIDAVCHHFPLRLPAEAHVFVSIKHRDATPPHDYDTMITSVGRMIEALESSRTNSSDVPDRAIGSLGRRSPDGTIGRPRIQVTADQLRTLNTGRTTRTHIADMFSCSERTIRRRLVDYGLSREGPPVYTEELEPDGTTSRVYYPGSSSDLSEISDNDLDRVILEIYHQFPSFGRRMIDGYLLQLGIRVPRKRLLASYERTIGPTTAAFGPRRIERRVYSVPGPNSLWHHDGQHGASFPCILISDFIYGVF
jgi:hypothetical protein